MVYKKVVSQSFGRKKKPTKTKLPKPINRKTATDKEKTKGSFMKTIPTNSKHVTGDFATYKPTKYIGDLPIIFRSSYELSVMKSLELNDTVRSWSSENIVIPYQLKIKQSDGTFKITRHSYYTDFTVISKTGKKYILEVKPEAFTPKTKAQIENSLMHLKNASKWKAALEWCKRNDFTFKIINEIHLKKKIIF